MHFSAGLLLDAHERLALVLFSEEAIAVSLGRFEQIPRDEQLQPIIDEVRWILVKRGTGPRFFLMESEQEMAPVEELTSARAKESGRMAISLASHMWPDWWTCGVQVGAVPVLIRLYKDTAMPQA